MRNMIKDDVDPAKEKFKHEKQQTLHASKLRMTNWSNTAEAKKKAKKLQKFN